MTCWAVPHPVYLAPRAAANAVCRRHHRWLPTLDLVACALQMQWRRLLACSSRPSAASEAEINTYVTECTETVEVGLPEALAACAYTEEVRAFVRVRAPSCSKRSLLLVPGRPFRVPPPPGDFLIRRCRVPLLQIVADTDVEIASAIERGDTATVCGVAPLGVSSRGGGKL